MRPGGQRAPGRGFWPMRDIPTLAWLLATVIAVILHRQIPVPRWLLIHLLLLGAITHSILVWSQYFSFALLRSSATLDDRRAQTGRLLLVNLGALLVLVGVPSSLPALTLAGASAVIAGVVWHGASLAVRMRGSLLGRFGKIIRYYIAAAAMLAAGAALGALIATAGSSSNLVLAHALLNVLGWVGLTVAGTVVTLWPTILRTRADDFAARGAVRALPVLAAGLAIAAVGAAAAALPVVVLGLLGYLGGLSVLGVSLWRAARRSAPGSFAALSVGAALIWWAGSVAAIVVGGIAAIVTQGGFDALSRTVNAVVPYFAAGFAAQILIGALSHLVPVVLGGGPAPVRVGTAALDRGGPLRVAVANSALVVCALPVPSLIRVVASMLFLVSTASFLPLMLLAMRAQRRAKRATGHPRAGQPPPEGVAAAQPEPGRRAGQAVLGLLIVLLTTVSLAAADPTSLGWGAPAAGDADAPVMTVRVEAADMRFTPDEIEVPRGTRLVIELVNTDASQTHDLVFENGVVGSRLAPGASETIDVGVVTGELRGWCSIVGHRQMGMELTVHAVDAQGDRLSGGDAGGEGHEHGGSAAIDLGAEPGAGFEPHPARLEPLAPGGPQTHEVVLEVEDTVVEVAPGVTQTLWTYNGTAPGPVLHGRVGDTFEVTLVNSASMGHSIDFHAGALAPDEPMRTIAPGESLGYTFIATRSGIWLYHCSTMPMSAHIANGMYGAVIIEPDDLPAVDHSYALVQGEYYLGDHDGGEVDAGALAEERPDLVAFNGYAAQYDHAPLTARVGERVRLWVLDAGPNRASSFHVVGGQFDTVWSEGRYLVERAEGTGAQALGLQPAQGGFVELVFPEAGRYPFVSHIMVDAERGAHGIVRVTD